MSTVINAGRVLLWLLMKAVNPARYLPLIKTSGRYHLDPTFLGKLSTRDIERFASLAGVRGLFPSLSDNFLRDIFDTRIQSALLVKGHHYESLAGKEVTFRQLEQAIVARHHVSFDYRKDEGTKQYASVAPYKLVNHKGIWYLAGRDAERLKTFAFGCWIPNSNPTPPSTKRSPRKTTSGWAKKRRRASSRSPRRSPATSNAASSSPTRSSKRNWKTAA